MKIRILAGVTSLAALVALAGVGCSSSTDPETGDQDSGAAHDGAPTHDGGAKDTSTPQVDGGADAEVVTDSSVPVDASEDASKDAGSDATSADASTSDAAPSDAAPSDGSANVDGSDAAIDAAAHDASTILDATADASDADAALVCAPANMSGFQPVWHGPVPHSNICTTAQIAAYHKCLTGANTAACAQFTGSSVTAADKACVACITTQDTASTYGPVIVHKGTIEMNVPGCLALTTNDPQGAGCAGKVQSANECRLEACSATCPVTDDASFQLEQQCETAAGAGTCKTETDASGCADGLVEAGGAPAACLTGQSFDDLYDAIVPVFCGP